MRYRAKLSRIATFLDAVLLASVITLLRANAKVHKKIQHDTSEHYDNDERLNHTIDVLDTALAVSVARLQRIEDKATSTVIGVGIAVTIIGSASAFLGVDGPLGTFSMGARVAVAALLLAGMLFLLLSSYLALRAYAIDKVYLPTLRDRIPLVSELSAKKSLLYCVEQNQRVGTLRANLLSSSFDCLRNGLIFVALLGVVLVFSSLYSSSAEIQPRFRANHPPHCHSNR